MNDTLNEAATLDPDALAAGLANEHAADIVERLNAEPLETASAVLSAMPLDRAVEVLDEPGLERAAELVEAQTSERAAALLTAMSADRRAEIFRHLDAAARDRLLDGLDLETRASLTKLLAYPENTAGSIMTTEFVGVPATWTVGEALRHIRMVESTRETIYAIYVLDPKTKALVKATSLRRLITGEPQQSVLSVCPPRRPLTVSPLTDREDVARLMSKYDLLAVPVVDRGRHVLGIVTVDDIIDAMIEESTEDVQKFGGMEALDAPYMDIGFLRMIQKRAGWLCALFLGEMLTASAMQHFEVGAGKGRRAHSLHPADHELGRQLGIAGDVAHHSRRCAARGAATRLVAGRAPRVADRTDAWRDSRPRGYCSHNPLAETGSVRLRRALEAGRLHGGGGPGGHRHLRLTRRLDAALHSKADRTSTRPAHRRPSWRPSSMSRAW